MATFPKHFTVGASDQQTVYESDTPGFAGSLMSVTVPRAGVLT